MNLRWAYRTLAAINDVKAVSRAGRERSAAPIGRRVGRRIYGKLTGRLARRLFG